MKAKRKNTAKQTQVERWIQRIVVSIAFIFICSIAFSLVYAVGWELEKQGYYPYVEAAIAEQCPDLTINIYEGRISTDPHVRWAMPDGKQQCSSMWGQGFGCYCGE